jgi:hypothetical protein
VRKRTVWGYRFFCLLLFLSALPLWPQPAQGLKIFQTENKFMIDGDLEDWAAVAEFPIQLSPEG